MVLSHRLLLLTEIVSFGVDWAQQNYLVPVDVFLLLRSTRVTGESLDLRRGCASSTQCRWYQTDAESPLRLTGGEERTVVVVPLDLKAREVLLRVNLGLRSKSVV